MKQPSIEYSKAKPLAFHPFWGLFEGLFIENDRTLIFKGTLSCASGFFPLICLWSESLYVPALSAYINKPKAFTNTHLCFQKFDKSLFSLSFLTEEGMGRFFEPPVSENLGEIALSAAAEKRRVITNSNGCFYINGSL